MQTLWVFFFIFYSKQLIPEFFQSSGEFLLNSQNLPLGYKQDKTKVMDVEIPPWAKGAVCIITCYGLQKNLSFLCTKTPLQGKVE